MVEKNGRGHLAVEGTLRPITGQKIGNALLDVSLRCGIYTRRQSSITFYISFTLIPTNKNQISTSRYFTQLLFPYPGTSTALFCVAFLNKWSKNLESGR